MSLEYTVQDKKENASNYGVLIVITGRSGVGKDYIFQQIIDRNILDLNPQQVVTHATREQRVNEVHGKDYYFISKEKIFEMHTSGLLVEEPVQTGTSYKATSKRELERVLKGKNLVWRIDIERAAEVATGDFFKRLFDNETADLLIKRTKVIYIDADDETLMKRRKNRDQDKFNQHEYQERDKLENELITKHRDKFEHIIENKQDEIERTIKMIEEVVRRLI